MSERIDYIFRFMREAFLARGAGHSRTLMRAANEPPGGIYVVKNMSMVSPQLGREFPNVAFVSEDSLNYLIGTRKPVLIDHFVLTGFFSDIAEEVTKLRRRVAELEGQINDRNP